MARRDRLRLSTVWIPMFDRVSRPTPRPQGTIPNHKPNEQSLYSLYAKNSKFSLVYRLRLQGYIFVSPNNKESNGKEETAEITGERERNALNDRVFRTGDREVKRCFSKVR